MLSVVPMQRIGQAKPIDVAASGDTMTSRSKRRSRRLCRLLACFAVVSSR